MDRTLPRGLITKDFSFFFVRLIDHSTNAVNTISNRDLETEESEHYIICVFLILPIIVIVLNSYFQNYMIVLTNLKESSDEFWIFVTNVSFRDARDDQYLIMFEGIVLLHTLINILKKILMSCFNHYFMKKFNAQSVICFGFFKNPFAL